jgi:hypothetical protein
MQVGSSTSGFASKVIAIGIIAIATIHLIVFFFFLYRTAIVAPISDMFDYIAAYLQYRDGTRGWINYLWLPHTEHRLMWTRILTLIDVELFHTSGIPFIVAATGFLLATAMLLWHQLRHAQNEVGGERFLALLAPMMILTTANVINCSVPINTTYPTTLFFIVLVLVLFAGAERFGKYRCFGRAAAVVAAFAAGLATGAGLLAWPILLWSAWQCRAGARWMAFLAAAGAAFFAIYLRDLPMHGLAPALQMEGASFLSFKRLLKLAHYFLAFLGLPFSREPALDLAGSTIGAVLLIGGLSAILWSVFSPRAKSASDQIGVGLIIFGLGSAALATVGRADLLEEVRLPVRYTMFVTALYVGLFYLLLPRSAPRFSAPGRRLSVGIAGVIIAALLLVQQIVVGRAAEQIAGPISAEADCFVEGIRGTETSKIISRDPESAGKILTALRRNGLLASRSDRCSRH